MTNIITEDALRASTIIPVGLPFIVPIHDLMLARCAGKVPGTVLTVEQMVYTVRICEYTEPLSYGRHWCYADMEQAVIALARYLADDDAAEPTGWVKAVTPAGVRRHGQPEIEVVT